MRGTRRTVLTRSGLLIAGVFAGCIGNGPARTSTDPENPGPSSDRRGFGAFFTLADWTQHVAGDHMDIEAPVPVGEIGHGWEPSAELQTQIAEATVFVYLDSPEFRWAQDTVASLENEGADVAAIDAMAGIDLIEFNAPDNDDHDDHGEYDPHVWVDPVFAQVCVENIAAGLANADPDNADDYIANAEAYNADLQALHDQFESTLARRHNDVLVLAGHTSYQYLATRYDFDIHSPQGVSPQDEPTTTDIIDTIELVNDHDIKYIAYDYFESDTLARQIVAESNAEAVVAMSPAEGTTTEWNENGWGYIEQMTELNLTALEAALDAH